MTLGQLARLSGKAALALREAEINENGPVYVHLKGRKPGLAGWLFAKMGLDDSTTLDVYGDRIEFSDCSLSGAFTETIPLTRVSNLGAGFLKPFALAIMAVVCLIAAIPTFGITLIPMAAICFRRSLIEGVDIGQEGAERIIAIVGALVEMNTKRQGDGQ